MGPLDAFSSFIQESPTVGLEGPSYKKLVRQALRIPALAAMDCPDHQVDLWLLQRDSRKARINQVINFMAQYDFSPEELPPPPEPSNPISSNAFRKQEETWHSAVLGFFMSNVQPAKKQRCAAPEPGLQSVIE